MEERRDVAPCKPISVKIYTQGEDEIHQHSVAFHLNKRINFMGQTAFSTVLLSQSAASYLPLLDTFMLLCQGPLKGVHRMPIGVQYVAIFFLISGNYVTQPLATWEDTAKEVSEQRSRLGLEILVALLDRTSTNEVPYYKTSYGTVMALLLLGEFSAPSFSLD